MLSMTFVLYSVNNDFHLIEYLRTFIIVKIKDAKRKPLYKYDSKVIKS